ncbi:hypothetical protein AAE478_000524 [Parahypoxylon ruwenzoriense]
MAQVAPGLEPEHNEPPCYNCGLRGHMFTACPEDPRKMPARSTHNPIMLSTLPQELLMGLTSTITALLLANPANISPVTILPAFPIDLARIPLASIPQVNIPQVLNTARYLNTLPVLHCRNHHRLISHIHLRRTDIPAPLTVIRSMNTIHPNVAPRRSIITNIHHQIPPMTGHMETTGTANVVEITNAVMMIDVQQTIDTPKIRGTIHGTIIQRQITKPPEMTTVRVDMAKAPIETIDLPVGGAIADPETSGVKNAMIETPTPSKVHQEREPGEIVSEPTSASDHGDLESASSITLDKPIEDYSWDEQTIFMEPPVATRADAIAAPLPSQYTEDVMIPPAFDAKGLKSQYITPRNIDDFAQSIRETRDWQIMQHHPAFLDPTDICLEKLDDYNKIIQMDMAHKNSRRDRLNNSHDVGRHRYSNLRGLGRHPGKNRDSRHKPDRGKRRWNEFHDGVDASRTERRYRDAPYDGSECKRYKPASPEPGEIIESSVQEPPNEFSKAHTVSTEDPKSALEPGELIEDTNMPPQILNNRGISPSRKTKSQQLDVLPPDERNGSNRARSPTPLRQSESPPRPQSRPSSRPSSRGSRGSQPNSRRSSFGSHMTDSQGSPLDSIDRELLGLERPSDSGSESERESPKRQLNPVTPKFKRRQPKVIEAYS